MTPEARQKLDGIVSQMDAGGASTEEIQAIVNDFKQKYDVAPAPQGDTRTGLQQALQPVTSALQGAGEFGTGLLKGAAKTVAGIPWVGKQIVPDVISNPKLAEPQGTAQQVGSMAAEAAPYFIPVGGEWALIGKAGNVLFKGALEAAKNYALASFQGGDPKTAAALGAAGPVANEILGPMGRYLTGTAKKAYERVLLASGGGREAKQLASKMAPEMLDRGVMAFTGEGLQKKVAAGAELADENIDVAIANLPADSKSQLAPVLQKIQSARDKLKVEGTDVIVRDAVDKALEKVQNKVLDVATSPVSTAGGEVPFGTSRSLKQQFGAEVAQQTKVFGKTGKEAIRLIANKEAHNAILAEMAKEYPDINVLNHEFHVWQTTKELLGEASLRDVGQATPVGRMIATHAGATIGAGIGGPVGAGMGAASTNALSKLFASPAWRTIGAVRKNRLAELLAAGRQHEAGVLAAQLAASYAGQP